MRALGRIHGSELSVVEFDNVDPETDSGVEGRCRGCPNLKKLIIENEHDMFFTNASVEVEAIATYCPNIEILSLHYWFDITDACIPYLMRLSALRENDLSDCGRLTSAGHQQFSETAKNLRVLKLSRVSDDDTITCTAFADAALLTCIGTHCPNLTTLHLALTSGPDVTDALLTAIIQGCPLLDLLIGKCIKPNNILSALASYCPRLKRLHMSHMMLTDEGLISLTQGCPDLVALYLSYCHHGGSLTDKGIKAIAAYCPQLQEFSVYYDETITDDSLCNLFASRTNLHTVSLCMTLITDRCIFEL